MNVLVACEFSQVVCKAFRDKGHEAYSCDILPTEGNPEWHIQDDVLKHLKGLNCPDCNGIGYKGYNLATCPTCGGFGYLEWDLMIAHPPCTYISYAGTSSWNNPGRLELRLKALRFFASLWLAPIEKICIENPMGCASPTIAKYTQVVQPYFWGNTESKRTCLWLKNLPKLQYSPLAPLFGDSTVVKPKIYGYYKRGKKLGQPIYGNSYLKFSDDRGLIRSIFWQGISKAMAEQWGNLQLTIESGRLGG